MPPGTWPKSLLTTPLAANDRGEAGIHHGPDEYSPEAVGRLYTARLRTLKQITV